MYNFFKKRDQHTPEPERKYGLYALSYYATGGLIGLLVFLFFSFDTIFTAINFIFSPVGAYFKFQESRGAPSLFEFVFIIVLACALIGGLIYSFSILRKEIKKVGLFNVSFSAFWHSYSNKSKFAAFFLLSFLILIALPAPQKEHKIQTIADKQLSDFVPEMYYFDENVHIMLLFSAFAIMLFSFLINFKWSIFRAPAGFPDNLYIGGLVILGVDALLFYQEPYYFYNLFLIGKSLFVPLVFFCFAVYWMLFVELCKESRFYQETVIEGRGQETNRLGGFLTHFKRDISSWFQSSQNQIIKTKESPIYLGQTRWQYDYKIGGRDIGIISDQHLITIAGSGAGKSRDSIFNNILTYNGGMIAFDTKGEHVALSYEKRKEYAPVYVLDPYKKTTGVPRAFWNPLDEIDPKSNTARSDLTRLCAALVREEKKETGHSAHFRDVPRLIIRGYIAHIITTYPKERQHLGTLYDLFVKGDTPAEGFDPRAVEEVITAMAKNDALGGAPSQAAGILAALSERDRSTHYTTIARSIDFLNDPLMRETFTSSSSFSIRDCKTKDASVFLILPEKQIYEMSRFLTLFLTPRQRTVGRVRNIVILVMIK